MRIEQTIRLSAPRESVWNLVADTDHLNREIGLPPIAFSFTPREAGGTAAWATARVAGITLRYREHPFDWERPSFYHVRRTFQGGPIREIVGGMRLEDEGGGTRVTVWAELEPGGALGVAACRVVGTKSVSDVMAACRRFEEYLSGRSRNPYPRHSARPPADRERLNQKAAFLRGREIDARLVELLAEHVAQAPPEDILAMRPFALADRWGVDRMDALRMFLVAAGRDAQLLEIRWRVLCPACRGGPPGRPHLDQLAGTVHCEACNIRFSADFDRSVEVCFAVAPAIWPAVGTIYCIGGPALSPHAAAQWALLPGESRDAAPTIGHGAYRLASLQTTSEVDIIADEAGAAEVCVRVLARGSALEMEIEPGPRVAPGARWRIHNDAAESVILRLETSAWAADAATAALVTSLQDFRDQFGSEVLSPGAEIAVRQICLLFSDLKGSTAMYRNRGDAPSYGAVRDHFEAMRRIVAAHDGAVIKTIGDAVMAAFHDPCAGVETALAIQQDAHLREAGLVVKLGLHYGPAIAVTANGILDYFGQTVNLAARLQKESLGGDVVLTESVAEDPRLRRLLESSHVEIEPFSTQPSGLDEPVAMVRLMNGRTSMAARRV